MQSPKNAYLDPSPVGKKRPSDAIPHSSRPVWGCDPLRSGPLFWGSIRPPGGWRTARRPRRYALKNGTCGKWSRRHFWVFVGEICARGLISSRKPSLQVHQAIGPKNAWMGQLHDWGRAARPSLFYWANKRDGEGRRRFAALRTARALSAYGVLVWVSGTFNSAS